MIQHRSPLIKTIRLNSLNPNLKAFNFCVYAHWLELWRQMRYVLLCQALCVNPFVVPSLIKCHCPDYPAVRHRSKWASSDGRDGGRGGGEWANEMLTDPTTITNQQSDLISRLAEWVDASIDSRTTLPCSSPCFELQLLTTQPNYLTSVHTGTVQLLLIVYNNAKNCWKSNFKMLHLYFNVEKHKQMGTKLSRRSNIPYAGYLLTQEIWLNNDSETVLWPIKSCRVQKVKRGTLIESLITCV